MSRDNGTERAESRDGDGWSCSGLDKIRETRTRAVTVKIRKDELKLRGMAKLENLLGRNLREREGSRTTSECLA